MKRIQKKCCAFLMAVFLVLCMMPGRIVNAVDANGDINAESEDYTENAPGAYLCEVNAENKATTYASVRNVDVPAGYEFVVNGCEFSILGTLTLRGKLTIFGENGKYTSTIWAESGAEIQFGSGANIPDGMELYDPEGNLYNEDAINAIDWTSFVYDGEKWIEKTFDMYPGQFVTRVEALVVDTEDGPHYSDYRVRYSYDYDDDPESATWFNAYVEDDGGENSGYIVVNDSNTDDTGAMECEFFLDNIPGSEENPWDGKVTIKIDIRDTPTVEGGATREIAFAELGIGEDMELMSYVEDGKTLTYTIDTNDESLSHFFYVELAYPNWGDEAIVNEVNNYLFAYSGSADSDFEDKLATELYDRFIRVPMFERFGFYYDGESEEANGVVNIPELKARIEGPAAGEDITVNLANGTTETRSVKVFTVNWGNDRQGRPVKSVIPVIVLNNENEFIVCTDFDSERGVGTTYYARTVDTDKVQFSDEPGDEGYIIQSDNYSNVVAGGNGVDTTVMNTEGLYTFQLRTMDVFETETFGYNVNVRIMEPSNTYVALHGEGEQKETGGLGLNGVRTDSIWETGTDAKAQVFIGDTTVYVQPLDENLGIANTAIESVRLKDESQRDGVTLDTTNLAKVKLSFNSNFYDSVSLIITYAGGTQKELTIERVGLVIQYWYLSGSPEYDEGDRQEYLSYDFKSGSCPFTYNYYQGEQILVYATYYHASDDTTLSGGDDLYLNIKYDDGNSEIIHHTDSSHEFNGYVAGDEDGVATTSFIIGFAPAKVFDGHFWGDDIRNQPFKNKFGGEGGLSATVINAGYNDDTSYGGTQVGSGSGVYWDGEISWY